MKENRIKEGRFSQHARGLGTVTRQMVLKRARELAFINGHPERILDTDFVQARRELTGEERLNPETTAAELVPEQDRWKPVAESEGHQAPTVATPDEQTFAEKLVEEGVEDAEQDQMVNATREDLKRQRRG
ncbi:MAG TPA: hypothetical protein VG146_07710 [Verrucomicrobiae bacterium]|nr:hypothetical protein [Verrucomicrobiae bacterium]